MRIPGAPERDAGERELLDGASRFEEAHRLDDLGDGVLGRIARERGIDFATALLHDRIVRSPPHAAFLERVFSRMRSAPAVDVDGFLLGVVPGAFWREYPHTGADGRRIAEAAEKIGLSWERLPLDSRGRVEENSRAIADWLAVPRGKHVLLASVSKGATDLVRAFSRPAVAGRAAAWLDLSGLSRGTPMVRWFEERPLRRLLLSSSLRLRGFDPAFLADLGTTPERTAPPTGLPIVRILGFPLERHCTHPLARRWWKRLAPLGPNDGAGMLADAVFQPGTIVPIWGCDHYLQPAFDPLPLLSSCLAELIADVRESRIHAASAVA